MCRPHVGISFGLRTKQPREQRRLGSKVETRDWSRDETREDDGVREWCDVVLVVYRLDQRTVRTRFGRWSWTTLYEPALDVGVDGQHVGRDNIETLTP